MAARRLHSLIYVTIASCCLAIIVCGVALGTNEWFRAEGQDAVGTGQVLQINYGLFKGRKVYKLGGVESNPRDLKVVCLASEAKCMYSCGTTASKRKEDLETLIKSGTADDVAICNQPADSNSRNLHPLQSPETDPNFEQYFLNFALYIMTIAFLAISMAFSALGGALALYNTYRTPIQPVFSVFGLFIWNGVSAAAVILAMIMWGVAYATALKKNAAVSQTLVPSSYASDGHGKLGISFWILILSPILSLANIGLLKYRSWKIIKAEENNVRVMTETLDNGDIILF